jgi:protein associated with RNAse G/E
MNIGDTIMVKAHKADGTCYQWWEATVVELDASHIVLTMPQGTPTFDTRKGIRPIPWHDRATYWFHKPYTFIESFDDAGHLIDLYLDICSSPQIVNGELHYTDYELDVERDMPHPARLVDEDEFAAAVLTYGYTPQFQAQCYAAAHEALDVANAYTGSGATDNS